MNEQMDETMRDGLRSAASRAGTPALTLDDVRGRARGIRRRRAAVGAGGAAALVAAAVLPVALLAGGGSSPDTLPPADRTPTVVDTANPVVEAYPPGWTVDGQVRSTDGTAFTPDVDGDITQLVRLGADRWVLGVQGVGPTGFVVAIVDSTGGVLTTHDALDTSLVGENDRTAAAWLDLDGQPHVLVAGTDEPVRLPVSFADPRSTPSLRAVLPGCTPDSCSVLIETYEDGLARTQSVTDSRITSPWDDLGLMSVTDVSTDGLVSGFTELSGGGSCSGVARVATDELLWQTCDHSTLRFSPDGRYVLGIPSQLSGFGHTFVHVLDARNGEVLRRFEAGTIFDERWDTDETFIVSLQTDEGRNELLRVGLDPAEVEVVESVPGTPGDPEGIIRLGG